MQVTGVTVKNFLSFGEEQQINFDNLGIIVGPNNSGKTNLFRAISFVGQVFDNKITDFDPYYHNADLGHPFDVSVGIQFDEEEIEALCNFLICSSLMTSGDRQQNEEQQAFENLKKEIILKYGKTFFLPLFKNVILEIQGQGQEAYPFRSMLRTVAPDKRELFMHYHGTITKSPTSPTSYSSWSFPGLLLDELRQRNPEAVRDYLSGTTREIPSFDYEPTNVFDLIFSKLDTRELAAISISGFGSNELERVFGNVQALIKLREFLRNRGFKEAPLNIAEVISRIYNSSIVRTSDIRVKPQAFLSTKSLESASYYNLTGRELPAILFKLKNSPDPKEKRRYAEILKVFEQITGNKFDILIRTRRFPRVRTQLSFFEPSELGLRIDMSPTVGEDISILGARAKKSEIIRYELVIQIINGDLAIPLDFAAAGIFETLVLLTAIIAHHHKVILLDEPALNLHPVLQKRIVELINEAIQSSNQIVAITHSPYLVDAEKLANIWRFVSLNGSTKAIDLAETLADVDKEDVQKFIKELRNSEVRSILFARGVILVEGPSDKIVIEKVDHRLSSNGKGANIEDSEWNVVAIEGKNSLGTFTKLASKLGIPYLCVMDYDALMQPDKIIRMNNGSVKTSVIPYYLHQADALTTAELGTIKGLESSIEEYDEQLWYNQHSFDILLNLARTHKIFIFTKDLEGVLQSPVTKKDSKPLRALDTITELLSNNKIPMEFYEMTDFIKNVILEHQ